MKNTSKRREEIIEKLRKTGSVTVNDLSSKYNVSTVTIRNDLSFLERNSALIRTHGGAISKLSLAMESTIEEKSTLFSQQKSTIANLASKFINDNDRIILDSGTTTEKIADYLYEKKDLIVMTNGINVAQKLLAFPNIDLMMTGGNLRKKSLSFYGTQAEESLKPYHFDKLFLGVDGIHLDRGITTHNENEARLNRIMSEIVDEIIIVSDSSKFGKIGLHKITTLDKITTLITDQNIPKEYFVGLKGKGINVIIAKQ